MQNSVSGCENWLNNGENSALPGFLFSFIGKATWSITNAWNGCIEKKDCLYATRSVKSGSAILGSC